MNIKNMTCREFFYKLRGKIFRYQHKPESLFADYESYAKQYKSYRYALKHGDVNGTCKNYFAAVPNPGAGIGHQLANWMAGFYFAKEFGLTFAHIPFSNEHYPLIPNKWDEFLGLGRGEEQYKDLKREGYKVVVLPKFDGRFPHQLNIISKIIKAYSNRKVIFRCTQDQFLRDLYLIQDDLKTKFYQAPSRRNYNLEYKDDRFNIAIHVRRTVIIDGKTIEETGAVRELRWLSNDYYEKVLKQVLENINPGKPIAVWVFSTGKKEEFESFSKYGEVHFCNDMDEYRSFAHLIFADLLITSKSSFSYKPALMNNGIKVCPRNFWHGYPVASDWILCENDGTFDVEKLKSLFKK